MDARATTPEAPEVPDAPIEGDTSRTVRGNLFRKYVALFVSVVCVALITNGIFDIWFSYREQRDILVNVQGVQAETTAEKISHFVRGIESQMRWTTQLPWQASTMEERRFDAARLLRQVPAITELALLDPTGRERLRVSRLSPDVMDSRNDLSLDPAFLHALADKVYYGPVYYRGESEPYMTLAVAGASRETGVAVAEVNLKFIWDVVSQIKVGKRGKAYVVDAQDRLIAHPDISLVLRNIDFAHLVQVRTARSNGQDEPSERAFVARDVQGRWMLSAQAPVKPPGWRVFVELPVEEAYAPLYASVARAGLFLLGALALAFFAGLFLARRMVVPIQALRAGAERIGGGDLGQRISIRTGDELEALGDQFNSMAAQLQESYATLERKVEERTHQLELANLAKSRFLAAASHDLRQPLHALGLFVAQLHASLEPEERDRVVGRIDASVAAMNELFNALLDISRLDAGVLAPTITVFPIERLLRRMESTFAGPAREKGLKLRVAPCSAWVRSDVILLERIMLNLVSNAVRYTARGGVLIGCRRRGDQLRIEIYDSGPGIPEDQRQNIFGEFYQLTGKGKEGRSGLGLGLAIVDRLCGLLNYPIDLRSVTGKGSRFSLRVPLAAAELEAAAAAQEKQAVAPIVADACAGKLVVVVDDDALVLDSMGGLLRSWGCEVVTARSEDAALTVLAGRQPDLIVSDYRLADGKTGIEVIARLRNATRASVPGFLISGDIAPDRLQEARASGYHLLHKPVRPMALRAMLTQLLRQQDVAGAA